MGALIELATLSDYVAKYYGFTVTQDLTFAGVVPTFSVKVANTGGYQTTVTISNTQATTTTSSCIADQTLGAGADKTCSYTYASGCYAQNTVTVSYPAVSGQESTCPAGTLTATNCNTPATPCTAGCASCTGWSCRGPSECGGNTFPTTDRPTGTDGECVYFLKNAVEEDRLRLTREQAIGACSLK